MVDVAYRGPSLCVATVIAGVVVDVHGIVHRL
jgi:hypothetical protein